jgi:hypothetical protein
MPYGLIALLAALASSAWFISATQASRPSKFAVAILCLIPLAIGVLAPRLALVGLLLQVMLVIGIALYAKMHAQAR